MAAPSVPCHSCYRSFSPACLHPQGHSAPPHQTPGQIHHCQVHCTLITICCCSCCAHLYLVVPVSFHFVVLTLDTSMAVSLQLSGELPGSHSKEIRVFAALLVRSCGICVEQRPRFMLYKLSTHAYLFCLCLHAQIYMR